MLPKAARFSPPPSPLFQGTRLCGIRGHIVDASSRASEKQTLAKRADGDASLFDFLSSGGAQPPPPLLLFCSRSSSERRRLDSSPSSSVAPPQARRRCSYATLRALDFDQHAVCARRIGSLFFAFLLEPSSASSIARSPLPSIPIAALFSAFLSSSSHSSLPLLFSLYLSIIHTYSPGSLRKRKLKTTTITWRTRRAPCARASS